MSLHHHLIWIRIRPWLDSDPVVPDDNPVSGGTSDRSSPVRRILNVRDQIRGEGGMNAELTGDFAAAERNGVEVGEGGSGEEKQEDEVREAESDGEADEAARRKSQKVDVGDFHYNRSSVLPSLREKHDEFLRELVKRWANPKIMVMLRER